jgi:hypothetical protein
VGDEMRLLPVLDVVRVRLLMEELERTREVVDIIVPERWWRVYGRGEERRLLYCTVLWMLVVSISCVKRKSSIHLHSMRRGSVAM